MKPRAFLGPAGTGKTTRLMTALGDCLTSTTLLEFQRILAVTRMHGARQRLEERLGSGVARGRFECMTLDRLAWLVVSRWRARVGSALPTELDFDATCERAGELLQDQTVARWVAAKFPIVIVDEFQDCHDGRLAIVKALANVCELIVGADAFQDLSGAADSPGVTWLQGAADVEHLTKVHRTSNANLLDGASAIRRGDGLKEGYGDFGLVGAQSSNVAASLLARQISWSKGQEVVILTPTGPARSRFVAATLDRLAEKPFEKDGKTFGPFTVGWERGAAEAEADLRAALGLPESGEPNGVVHGASFPIGGLPGQCELAAWLDGRRSLLGQVAFTRSEIDAAIARCIQQHRAHSRPSRKRLRAMTIHQAKNREFDRVIVLWPFEVQTDDERLRRLLYNAVTRARQKALVIVQDPKKERLRGAPFRCTAPETAATAPVRRSRTRASPAR